MENVNNRNKSNRENIFRKEFDLELSVNNSRCRYLRNIFIDEIERNVCSILYLNSILYDLRFKKKMR